MTTIINVQIKQQKRVFIYILNISKGKSTDFIDPEPSKNDFSKKTNNIL